MYDVELQDAKGKKIYFDNQRFPSLYDLKNKFTSVEGIIAHDSSLNCIAILDKKNILSDDEQIPMIVINTGANFNPEFILKGIKRLYNKQVQVNGFRLIDLYKKMFPDDYNIQILHTPSDIGFVIQDNSYGFNFKSNCRTMSLGTKTIKDKLIKVISKAHEMSELTKQTFLLHKLSDIFSYIENHIESQMVRDFNGSNFSKVKSLVNNFDLDEFRVTCQKVNNDSEGKYERAFDFLENIRSYYKGNTKFTGSNIININALKIYINSDSFTFNFINSTKIVKSFRDKTIPIMFGYIETIGKWNSFITIIEKLKLLNC